MKKSMGFTLLELMVVLSIIAILTMMAVPSLKQMIQSITISSAVNTFLADMRYARSESIRRGGGVVMCRSDAPEATDPVCNADSGPGRKGWVSGWIIYIDSNNNGKINPNELLRVQSPITSVDSIREGSDAGSDSSTKFSFTATGRLNLSAATSIRFGGNEFANTIQRRVCVNLGGRARIVGDGSLLCSGDKVTSP